MNEYGFPSRREKKDQNRDDYWLDSIDNDIRTTEMSIDDEGGKRFMWKIRTKVANPE